MNIAYFLLPKAKTAYLYEDFTFRQGLEKMRHHGYKAIPVISRSGQYIGSVTEGDFLWHILDENNENAHTMRDLEQLKIRDILKPDRYPPIHITITMDELLESAVNQSFIPVVDDLGNFVGIVTRKDIMRYFSEQTYRNALLSKII